MNQRERDALDRHITGNGGEDQLAEDEPICEDDEPVADPGEELPPEEEVPSKKPTLTAPIRRGCLRAVERGAHIAFDWDVDRAPTNPSSREFREIERAAQWLDEMMRWAAGKQIDKENKS